MKSFVSADVQVKMRENLVNLFSQHPTLHDKHRKYLNDHAEDDVWLEVAQQLGYNEDGNVAVIHFLTHACTRHHFLAVTMYHAAL